MQNLVRHDRFDDLQIVPALDIAGHEFRDFLLLVGMVGEILVRQHIQFGDGFGRGFTVLRLGGFLLTAAPGVRIVFDRGDTEELQQEITVGIGQAGAKRLRSVSLLADHDPGNHDAFGRVVIIHPGVGHLALGQNLGVLFVINLAAALVGLGFHVGVGRDGHGARDNLGDQGYVQGVHKTGDLGEDQRVGDVTVAVCVPPDCRH